MARKGENIYKRKDGRWEGRYVRSVSADGKKKYGYCYAHSYREVREKLYTAKGLLIITAPGQAKRSSVTVTSLCDFWLGMARSGVRESTFVKYDSMIRLHIKPAIGGYLLSELCSSAIEELKEYLLFTKKLSPKTVKDILVLLKTILRFAARRYPDDIGRIDITFPREQKKELRVLSVEEQKILTEYLMNSMDSLNFGILLSLSTGLRIGEVCALRWSDISFQEKVIRVGATMQRLKRLNDSEGGGNSPETRHRKTKVMISAPKSEASVREIPMTEFVISLCKRFSVEKPEAFIMTGTDKHYIEPRTLQYRFEQITEACGLKNVHFHTLRHSFATRCVEVDFEIKSLSEILGHSNTRITLERYVHTSMELKRKNMNKLAKIGY